MTNTHITISTPRTNLVPISAAPPRIFSQHTATGFHQFLSSKSSLLSLFSHILTHNHWSIWWVLTSTYVPNTTTSYCLPSYWWPKAWFSNFDGHQNFLGCLLQHRFLGPTYLYSLWFRSKVESRWCCYSCPRNHAWELLSYTKSPLPVAYTISHMSFRLLFFSPCSLGVCFPESSPNDLL